tara:strand:- start:1351 stop:1962 length:612 start_codon:yes stop_codon:yes gene_type:complete
MIKYIFLLTINIVSITFVYSQERNNYLPSDFAKLSDSIKLSDIYINGNYFPQSPKDVISLFGSPDDTDEFESDIDEGAFTLGLSYGCFSFEDCKEKSSEITEFNFQRFEDFKNGKYFFNNFAFSNPAIRLTVKNQDIFIGDGVERLKELFPESYRFYQYKIDEDITDRGSYVGVYILNEYKQLVFQIDEKSKEICRISIFPTE